MKPFLQLQGLDNREVHISAESIVALVDVGDGTTTIYCEGMPNDGTTVTTRHQVLTKTLVDLKIVGFVQLSE